MWLKRNFAGKRAALDQLGALETEIMERIWKRDEVSVRDLHDDLSGRLAYTTIMTTLDRLYKKGLLSRRKEGKAFFYRAAFTEQQYQERVAQHLFGMVLKGTGDSHLVLSRFLDAVIETDRQMLDQLDELVKAKRRAMRRTE
jgi:predicted transcriptional regulator